MTSRGRKLVRFTVATPPLITLFVVSAVVIARLDPLFDIASSNLAARPRPVASVTRAGEKAPGTRSAIRHRTLTVDRADGCASGAPAAEPHRW